MLVKVLGSTSDSPVIAPSESELQEESCSPFAQVSKVLVLDAGAASTNA